MSERTFRAVVASVLVGALALGVIVATVAFLPRSPEPSPKPPVAASATPSPTRSPVPTRSPAPTPTPGPAFAAPDVVGVGLISRGASSGTTLVLQFLESSVDAIPAAPGSFRMTLADHAGDGTTVEFVGTPSVVAPGSLRARAMLVAPNVLMVTIGASDLVNVELLTISGLGISASSTAALGPVNAQLDGFTGSLVTGAEHNVLPSPGSVIASP